MSDAALLPGEPEDTHEAIMWATFAALQKHGYAGLSISRIAAEAEVSKSTFYHHFDGKGDILSSFVQYMCEYFVRGFRLQSTGDPVDDLHAFVDIAFGEYPAPDDLPGPTDHLEAYIELRAQAVRNPVFREDFTAFSEELIRRLTEIIESGIDQGVFRDVDAERVAEFLVATIDGINLHRVTRERTPVGPLRETVEAYIESELLVEAVDAAGDD